MTSSKESAQDNRRNGLRLPPLSTSFNSEPSHQYHNPISTDPSFNLKRSSQRNKYISAVADTSSTGLKRRSSRFGISSLFSRSKPLMIEEGQEKLGVHLECDEPTGAPTSADTAGQPTKDFEPLPEMQTLPEIVPPTATIRNRASKTALRSRPSPKSDATSRSPTAWDPPPLFHAYPQAVRHVTLRAPSLSAEAILRLNAERSSCSNQRVELYTPEVSAMKFAKEKKLKRPTPLDMLSKGDWMDKTFVLVTSGYLLQYAGQGSFDRLPEKIMLLSKESVAFASDAIPGKPYVLQISQLSDEDKKWDREASRSMFKGRGLRSQLRRSTSNFLLVFEGPEELSSWMVVVRKQIQSMGGKDCRSDVLRKPAEVESIQDLHQGPSQRSLVERDPNYYPDVPDQLHDVTSSANTIPPEISTQVSDSADPSSTKRQSMATQQSVDSRTTSNAADSINQIHLDRLKESPRQSYASTAGKTTSTSRDSSPGASPVNLHADIPQWTPSLNEKRQTTSMYHGLVRSSVQQLTLSKKARRESTISPAAPPSQPVATSVPQQQRAPSPAAPNFSVPTFSKRYSSSNNSPALSCTTSKPQTPPVALVQASSSPPVINEEDETIGRRASTVGEIQYLQKPTLRSLNDHPSLAITPPRSPGSCGPPSSSDGDRPFSRRFSSLEYSKGVSPIHLAHHSPSPHPPPTAPLPAIPGAQVSSRTSFMKPPLAPLPPVPVGAESVASSSTTSPPTALPASPSATPSARVVIAPSPPPSALPETESLRRDFGCPPPTKPLPAVPVAGPPSYASVLPSPPSTPIDEPTAHEPPVVSALPQEEDTLPSLPEIKVPHPSSPIKNPMTQELTQPDPPHARNLRRPVSMQVRSQHPKHATPPQTAFKTTLDIRSIAAPPTESLPSPPRPTRDPPPPPSEEADRSVVGKSSSRIGREPPPISTFANPRSTISVISSPNNYFEQAAPHPFIPPIKVSERKFRGSLDGPWNPAYGGPQRNFLDLSGI